MANAKQPPPPCPLSVNILGASARAAAFSALRGGLVPVACDIFGDMDLRAVARFVDLRGEYPAGFERALKEMEDAPFVYTGGLENHPELIDRLAALRPLWGNDGGCLRRARDPVRLAEALRDAGTSPPEVRRGSDPPRDHRGWLRKPLRGAGGRGIAPAGRALVRGRSKDDATFYYQRRVPGRPCSSLHAASADGCKLLGATRQLVGERWLHAKPFAWCGSVGPLGLSARVEEVLRFAGEAARRTFGLRGLFGIDFLLDGETVQPVELNPRYTASAEVLEHALGFSAIALHAACFRRIESPAQKTPGLDGMLAKAVLFAPRGLIRTSDLAETFVPDPFRFPRAADIPSRGSTIAGGHPVLTVFARSTSEEECIAALRQAAEGALGLFRPA